MIGSVAIQRLLEAAILLKLERGTRGSDAQSSAAQKASTSTGANQQPAPQTAGPIARGAHFTQASTWSNAPVIPADLPVAAAAASVLRETAVAPLAYREAISEATPGARTGDQTSVPANAVPAAIVYAHPELALVLSRTTSGTSARDETAAKTPGALLNQAKPEQRAILHPAKLIALITGSAVTAATLAILVFG